jgi:hypothetical protein
MMIAAFELLGKLLGLAVRTKVSIDSLSIGVYFGTKPFIYRYMRVQFLFFILGVATA